VLGCGRTIAPPGIAFAGVDFRGGDSVTVRLTLENPNPFALKVTAVDYRALIAGELCGSGRRSEPLVLKPGESVEAGFPVKVDYSNVVRVLPVILKDTVTFSVSGSFSVPVFLGSRRLPFKSESRVDVRSQLESFLKAMLKENSEE
jgi:LEA14-like dessication related protein